MKVAPIEKLHREAACDHPCQLTCSNCARSFSFGGCFREGGGRAANQRARPMVGRQCKPPQTRGALEFKLYVRTATISFLLLCISLGVGHLLGGGLQSKGFKLEKDTARAFCCAAHTFHSILGLAVPLRHLKPPLTHHQ